MNQDKLRIALIGCGGFGEFCLDAFSDLSEVEITVCADTVASAAQRLAGKFQAEAITNPEEVMNRSDVDLVHVATPPSSHYELVLAALAGGKHVLCEKPLAMSTAQADEMISRAREAQRILPVNFVMRYNQVTNKLKQLLDSGALGEPISARLTNCASDAKLGLDHWFWDPELSGGIFIEHGVHFFDLYRYLFGEGKVTDALTIQRNPTGQEDRVMCTVLHESGFVASHYHGFDQVMPMDRTRHRIVCERGDVYLEGWIPLEISLDAAVDQSSRRKLQEILEGADVDVVQTFRDGQGSTRGRGKDYQLEERIRMQWSPSAEKQTIYAASVRDLLADQIAYLKNPDHQRTVREENGRTAVALAQAARDLAPKAR